MILLCSLIAHIDSLIIFFFLIGCIGHGILIGPCTTHPYCVRTSLATRGCNTHGAAECANLQWGGVSTYGTLTAEWFLQHFHLTAITNTQCTTILLLRSYPLIYTRLQHAGVPAELARACLLNYVASSYYGERGVVMCSNVDKQELMRGRECSYGV